MIDSKEIDEETPPAGQDYLEKYYWPALDRMAEALGNYQKELPTNNSNEKLPKDHPAYIELNIAHKEWVHALREMDMVKKLIDDHELPQQSI